jgi:hypothetical protein
MILSGLIGEGPPVETTRLDYTTPYDQPGVITELARRALDLNADWIFPLDGDELLNPRDSVPRGVLAGVGREIPLALPWETYVPRAEHPVDVANPLRRMTWRLVRESRPFHKVVIPADLMRTVSPGSGEAHIFSSAMASRFRHNVLRKDGPSPTLP